MKLRFTPQPYQDVAVASVVNLFHGEGDLEIAEEATQYVPRTIIFVDECFSDSNVLTNVGMMLDKATIEFRWV